MSIIAVIPWIVACILLIRILWLILRYLLPVETCKRRRFRISIRRVRRKGKKDIYYVKASTRDRGEIVEAGDYFDNLREAKVAYEWLVTYYTLHDI